MRSFFYFVRQQSKVHNAKALLVLTVYFTALPHHHYTTTITGTRVFLSVAVDIVVQEIQEPVRFLIETKARVFPQHEKFWYFGRKILQENFYLKLNEVCRS